MLRCQLLGSSLGNSSSFDLRVRFIRDSETIVFDPLLHSFSLSFRVHICLRQLAAMMAAYTRKSLQQLDQPDVYAPRIRHSHVSGVSCLSYSGAQHLFWFEVL